MNDDLAKDIKAIKTFTSSRPADYCHAFFNALKVIERMEQQPEGCTAEETFKAGKEVGEIAGKVAADALAEARYQRDRIERAYKQLLSEMKRESSALTQDEVREEMAKLHRAYIESPEEMAESLFKDFDIRRRG